jgi:hypothetical protein
VSKNSPASTQVRKYIASLVGGFREIKYANIFTVFVYDSRSFAVRCRVAGLQQIEGEQTGNSRVQFHREHPQTARF